MALNFEEQLDRFTGLISTSVGSIGRAVLRVGVKMLIDKIGLDRFKTELSDLGASLVDDGDDEGLDEYVESVKKKEVRKSAETAAEKIHQWANR